MGLGSVLWAFWGSRNSSACDEVTKQAITLALRVRLLIVRNGLARGAVFLLPKCKNNTAQAVPAEGAASLLLTSSTEQLSILAHLFPFSAQIPLLTCICSTTILPTISKFFLVSIDLTSGQPTILERQRANTQSPALHPPSRYFSFPDYQPSSRTMERQPLLSQVGNLVGSHQQDEEGQASGGDHVCLLPAASPGSIS